MTDDVALKEHVETLVRNLRDYVDSKDEAVQRALDISTRSLHDKFEQIYQLREQVAQERGVFVRRELLDAIYERLSRLELAQSTATGRWAGISLAAAIVGALITFIVTKMLK